MNKVDRRVAISQIVTNAAFAVLAAKAAVLVFALDKRNPSVFYWVFVVIGVALLVWSVIVGARGVAQAENPAGRFDKQAKFCLAGFLIVAASLAFLGKRQEDTLAAEVVRSREMLSRLETTISHLQREQQALIVIVDSLRTKRKPLSSVEPKSTPPRQQRR